MRRPRCPTPWLRPATPSRAPSTPPRGAASRPTARDPPRRPPPAPRRQASTNEARRTCRICQSYLPPGGTDASRAAGDAQEVAFNNILGSVCAQYGSHCLYDGGAGYSEFKFSTADVSTVDYFHPSVTGQRDVAAFTWAHSYWPAM